MRFGRLMVATGLLFSALPAAAKTIVDTDALIRFNPDALGLVFNGIGRGSPSVVFPNPPNNRSVQSFTAGRAGRLAAIEFQIFRPTNFAPGQLVLELIEGDFRSGGNLVRGSREFAVGDLRTTATGRELEPLLRFDTAEFELDVDIGTRFSVIFSVVPDGQSSTAQLLIGNSLGIEEVPGLGFRPIVERSNYAGGDLASINSQGNVGPAGLNDIGFRTFVVSAVPEPASWAMMIAGFGLAGAVLRRRRETESAGPEPRIRTY
jgi:hypothetical protein